MPICRASSADGRRSHNCDDLSSAMHPQGAAEAVGLLPMLGQGRCDDLVRLVDQLSPIV